MRGLQLCIAFFIGTVLSAVKFKSIIESKNVKELKKILKTNKNVLILYTPDEKSALPTIKYMEPLAKDLKGQATFVYINCGVSKESKKLCKKYGATSMVLKHYKDGEFNKDYDRRPNAKSMLAFMLDPTGDAPWDEDTTANDVAHVSSEQGLNKLRKKVQGPLLVMFYAPWCGYCKKLKPDYAAAATALKGKGTLAGMDVDKPDTHNVKTKFNITGYPTLIYFEKGEEKFQYGGEMNKDGLIEWMKNPTPKPAAPKEPEVDTWAEDNPEVLHMNDKTFAPSLQATDSVLVMFYAPWCGHCKKMKPEFVEAAKQMKHEGMEGALGAVDCTTSQATCGKFDVKGYPTVKYFNKGEVKFDVNAREKEKIVEFMQDPKEPPPPPPEELPWAETSGDLILHLKDDTFKDTLKKKKHVLVMFYAPWCGHCKKAKPEFQEAAEAYKDDRKVFYAGVDCTVERKVCESYEVTGYPTIRYFSYGKNDFKYSGGRTAADFKEFMVNPKEPEEPKAPPPWKDTPSDVVHLTDATFEDAVASTPKMFVMFYAPWCGHCNAMKPDFIEAASIIKAKSPTSKLAALDCTVEKATRDKFDIKGFPTLIYFENGEKKVDKYTGSRTTEAFVNLIMDGGVPQKAPEPAKESWKDEASAIQFLTHENIDSFVQENKNVLVLYYAPWCGHCKMLKPELIAAADQLQKEEYPASIAAVDCTEEKDRCEKENIEGYPTMKFYKDGQLSEEYSGERTKDGIIEWIRGRSEPEDRRPANTDSSRWQDLPSSVFHLTEDTFEILLKQMDYALVLFYTPNCEGCLSLRSEYMKAAARLRMRNNMQLTAVDCKEEEEVCAKAGVKSSETAIKLYRNGAATADYEGGHEADAFVAYLEEESKRKTEL